MWIYDGERWIEEGVNENANATKPDPEQRQEEMAQPDLQVVEVPVPARNYVPPFPLP